MKTYTDLYQQICTFPALYRAYQLCCKGKRDKEYAIEFEQDLEVYRDHIKVLSRNVQRAYKRLEQMEAGTFDGDARSSIASWIGYTKHADCHGLNCQIAERHPFLRVAFDPVEVTE
jgi:hypothetical protein